MKFLIVYNTCGIRVDNTDWYIDCIKSFLDQEFDDFHIVLSSCMNSIDCIKKIHKTFGNSISYCFYPEPYTVNITFNKTVQECVNKFGEFEYYAYVDSGCTFGSQADVLSKSYESLKKNDYGMLSLQVSTDEALQAIDPKYKYETEEVQIVGEDLRIPLGKACNAHVIFYSNEYYKTYDGRLWPDVFAAFCTESTFTFLCSAIKKYWAILKDIKIEHLKAADGPSSSVPHSSIRHKNTWNNLLYGRNALNFIEDQRAIQCGLGYEECNNVMMHGPEAYDDNGFSTMPEELISVIKQHFFLTKEELDYENIKHRFVPRGGAS